MKSKIFVNGNLILQPDAAHGRIERERAGEIHLSVKVDEFEDFVPKLQDILNNEYGIFAPEINKKKLSVLLGFSEPEPKRVIYFKDNPDLVLNHFFSKRISGFGLSDLDRTHNKIVDMLPCDYNLVVDFIMGLDPFHRKLQFGIEKREDFERWFIEL